MVDYRIDWLRDRIAKILGVSQNQDVLDKLINDHGDAFQVFFDQDIDGLGTLEEFVFYIYRTFYDKLVEREVITLKKGK